MVFLQQEFSNGDFLLEYCGELMDQSLTDELPDETYI